MTEHSKPLPVPSLWSKPFWEGCRRQELLIQKCNECQTRIFYPKLYCPNCLSPNIGWEKASGRGKVYTFTIARNYVPTPFAKSVPYVLAVVKLTEGVQMLSNIVGCAPDQVRCDMDVEVTFENVGNGIILPKFKPASVS